MIEGFSSAEAISRRLEALRPGCKPVTRLGGIPVGDLGWGTQSGEVKNIVDSKYERMLPSVLEAGLTVIDTSPAYRCQRSQKAVGRELARTIRSGKLRREELTLVTHAGWLAFERKEEDPAEFLASRVLPATGLKAGDFVGGVWSMHPKWIRHQVDLACDLSGMAGFDLLMLDSVELGRKVWSRDEWRIRLTEAFAACEQLAAEGRIRAYGICSMDGFRPQENQVLALNPEELRSLARSAAGGDSRLAAVQLPFNLAMLESMNAKGSSGQELFAMLREYGWWTIGCLPLGQGQLTRGLPDALCELMPDLSDAQRALEFARSAPPLDTVLIGMKTREHVDENLALLQHPRLDEPSWLSLFASD